MDTVKLAVEVGGTFCVNYCDGGQVSKWSNGMMLARSARDQGSIPH